jgi:hypothetical protein
MPRTRAFFRFSRNRLLLVAAGFFLAAVPAIVGLYAHAGMYGLNAVLRRGATFWVSVTPDDARLSPSMRLALREPQVAATAGAFTWQQIERGFEVGELAVIAEGSAVDRILLARIDPARFRFVVRNRHAGDRDAPAWLDRLDAALIINGSYFLPDGTPETPFLTDGELLGPRSYDARHGAFVTSAHATDIHDLTNEDWPAAVRDAQDAMVSYPLLVAADGTNRVKADDRWLANRSFVGIDGSGHVVLGTTTDAFFSLNRLAAFLSMAPLDLVKAVNLDGGPVACQTIRLGTYRRDFCGKWELAARDGELKLLRWTFGARPWALPNVLAALRKESS